jgi:tetratricopeptide (TPR) repeat protein
MRKINRVFPLVLVLMLCVVALPYAAAQDSDPRGDTQQPAHLVLSVTDGGEALINRMDWNVNAFAPVQAGTSVRSGDYIDVSGRTTLKILCADLKLIEQLGSEAPQCDPYAANPAFLYPNSPVWSMVGQRITVVTFPSNLASTPDGVETSQYSVNELAGGNLDTVVAMQQTITGLALEPEQKAFALGSLYRGQGMIFEALNTLTAITEGQCSRTNSVNASQTGTQIAASPVLYLRIGELYDILGLTNDAARYYQCAVGLAQENGDQASAGLAFARQANIAPDPVQAISLYQLAIDNYTDLGANDDASALLDICGQRNCTLE